MASRKIQLLRSTTVYNTRELAEASLSALFAQQANLADGEVVLARYKTTDEQDNEIIKAVLGIYNSKSNMSGFTIVRDAEEASSLLETLEDRVSDLESEVDGMDLVFNIDGEQDTNVPQTAADNSRVVTSLLQQNGQVYVGEVTTQELGLKDYVKLRNSGPIAANDTLQVAFSKLENAKVSIDNTTIQNNQEEELYCALKLIKVDDEDIVDPNVREQYVLGYQVGDNDPVPVDGGPINVYKDSALKEVYIGTLQDTVDSETGEVRKMAYALRQPYYFINSETYDLLYVNEKPLYEYGSLTTYHIINNTLTPAEYELLPDWETKELYELVDEDPSNIFWTIRVEYISLTEDEYEELTANQKQLYNAVIENGYLIKDEYKYITNEEYTEIEEGNENPQIRLWEAIGGGFMFGERTYDVYQSMNFVYYLTDGTYEMVKIDLSKFIAERDIGDGIKTDENGFISVFAGNGLDFGNGQLTKRPLVIKIDPTSDSALSVSADGLKLDLTEITSNALNEVEGIAAIDVSAKANNKQTIMLVLSETLTNSADAQYAGEIVEEEVGGETVETVVSNNILQIKNDGLYLDSTWDCGEY